MCGTRFHSHTHLSYMVTLNVNRGDALFLNDGDQHLHLQVMEAEEADHLHMCAKESAEGSERSLGEFMVPPSITTIEPWLCCVPTDELHFEIWR